MRRLAALYSQEIDRRRRDRGRAEPTPCRRPRTAEPGVEPAGEGLSAAVERHLRDYFAAHDGGLPASGLYDRVLREVERPLIALTPGGHPRQPDPGGRDARPQPQHAAQEDPRVGHPGGPWPKLRPLDRERRARTADDNQRREPDRSLAAASGPMGGPGRAGEQAGGGADRRRPSPSGIATYAALSEQPAVRHGCRRGLAAADARPRPSCCCSAPSWRGGCVGIWVERRRGSAGSRLHVRLVVLFSRGGGGARHPGRDLLRRVLPFRRPDLVHRTGRDRDRRIALGRPGLSRGAPAEHPLRGAEHGQHARAGLRPVSGAHHRQPVRPGRHPQQHDLDLRHPGHPDHRPQGPDRRRIRLRQGPEARDGRPGAFRAGEPPATPATAGRADRRQRERPGARRWCGSNGFPSTPSC